MALERAVWQVPVGVVLKYTYMVGKHTKARKCRTVYYKVKVKVKVKFTLEQATKAQRWSRGIALLFL